MVRIFGFCLASVAFLCIASFDLSARGRSAGGSCGPSGCSPSFEAPMYFAPPVFYFQEPAPVAPKASSVPAPVQQNFGVDFSKIEDHDANRNGKSISFAEAAKMVGGKIPDDRGKFCLTVIGSDAQRKPVTEAYASLDQATKDRVRVWSVAPDHFSLKDLTTNKTVFATDGTPTVYLQAPDGQVLHRQDNWVGAEDFGAIRRAIKEYDLKKDPDLRKPILPKPLIPSPILPVSGGPPVPLLFAGGGAGLLLALRRRGVV